MKQSFFALLTLFVASCTTSSVFITQSKVPSKDSVYIFENEAIKITFNFWNQDTKMKFSIYNKTDDQIFVDWKNSALIVNDNSFSYWESNTLNRIAFIPPHSRIWQLTKGKNHFSPHSHVRNYITYSSKEDFSKEYVADCDFEIIKIIKTSSINKYKDERNFYSSKEIKK